MRKSLTGVKFLVVEDEVDASFAMRTLLSAMGAEVYVAHDGEEGLLMATSLLPHCVITDIRMPKLDGRQMVEAMQKDRRTQKIMVVTLTNYDVNIAQDMAAGAQFAFEKPLNLEKIKTIIGLLVDARDPVVVEAYRQLQADE